MDCFQVVPFDLSVVCLWLWLRRFDISTHDLVQRSVLLYVALQCPYLYLTLVLKLGIRPKW